MTLLKKKIVVVDDDYYDLLIKMKMKMMKSLSFSSMLKRDLAEWRREKVMLMKKLY